MKNIITAIAIGVFSLSSLANTTSSYVGQETREIKALSQQDVLSYLNGKGLGYAKAAELNQYPGPSHVLEMAKNLNLSEEQVKLTQEIFNNMEERAQFLGKQFVDKEQELDHLFSKGTVDEVSLKKVLSDIGMLQSNIRFVHLSAHLEQKALLTKHQVNLYSKFRGYNNPHNSEGHHYAH